jgi:hypothetical protein
MSVSNTVGIETCSVNDTKFGLSELRNSFFFYMSFAGTYREFNSSSASSAATCSDCPSRTTTSATGGTSVAACNTCVLGYGGASCSTQCGGTLATFGDAGRPTTAVDGKSPDCKSCPISETGFYFAYGTTVVDPYTSASVARLGAESLSDCISLYAQIQTEAWYLQEGVGAGMESADISGVTGDRTSQFRACVDACGENCQFLTFDYATGQCKTKPAAVQNGT